MGIAYSDLLDLDIRRFNNIVDGYILRRQTNMNDTLQAGHVLAGKLISGIYGSKEFKKPIKEFKLLEEEDTVAARNKKVYNALKAKGII